MQHLLKTDLGESKKKSSKGLQQSNLQRKIPCDMNLLVERLELLLDSRQAGNTSKLLTNES